MSASAPVRLAALGAVLAGAAAVYARVAEPHLARWGSTEAERRSRWPGDELADDPGFVWTNAVTIDRPASEVWPWIAQLGQARGGLYSYDWLENLLGCDVHSARRILPQFQERLAVGADVVRMCRYAPHNPVARFDPGRALVLGDVRDSAADLAAGRARSTWAFVVEPAGADSCRLVVRSRASSAMARIQGPVQFVMQRRSMLGIKERAEGTSASWTVVVLEPLLWLVATAVFAAGAALTMARRERWWRPLVVSALAIGVAYETAFRQPPLGAGGALVGASVLALVLGARPKS